MKSKSPLTSEIKGIIQSVVEKVSQTVQISKAYLYGSYYNGSYTKESDLDLAFFLADENECLLEAHRKILKITSKYNIDIQPQTFYASELEDVSGIVGEICENGIEIEKII